jgi:hypothetical protein
MLRLVLMLVIEEVCRSICEKDLPSKNVAVVSDPAKISVLACAVRN